MKFAKPTVKLIGQEPGEQGILRIIERAGRVAYKSEDRITEDSASAFVDMLVDKKHLSPLEHGTVYLDVPEDTDDPANDFTFLAGNPYSFLRKDDGIWHLTANYRVLVENGQMSLLRFLTSPGDGHERRFTFHITCSRGVSHELVRHRKFSFTQESTRYCNYTKDKFGGDLTFMIPSWIHDVNDGDTFCMDDIAPDKLIATLMNGTKSEKTLILVSGYLGAETVYKELMAQDCKPEQAREVLSTGVKTEIVMTGTLTQWEHFLKLRSPGYGAKGVHPDMAVIADLIYLELEPYLTQKNGK